MPPAPRQSILDRSVPLLVGLTVVAFATGSSSVPRVTTVGHSLRWGFLVVLLGAAGGWALPRPRLTRPAFAAAFGLVALATLSTLWSVKPRISFERSASLGMLFAVCLLLAAAVRERPARARLLLGGVLGGTVAVAVIGLLLLVVDHARAVEAASYEAPARYRGFGQDPNTGALLFGIALPVALWWLLESKRRMLALGALLLLAGTIVASGSRGGLLSAAAGSAVVVVALVHGRTRLAAGLIAVAVLAAVGAGIQSLPKPSTAAHATATSSPSSLPKPRGGYLDAEARYPLEADVGRPLPGGGEPPVRRSFFGASGRVAAWTGALHEAARRPLVGHGFGTEQDVFVDRYYSFVGGLPENSYLGLALQLGLAGLVALFVLVYVLAAAGLRGVHRSTAVAAGLGVLAAGLVAGMFQSYLYSTGNIATAALWIPAFLLGSVSEA